MINSLKILCLVPTKSNVLIFYYVIRNEGFKRIKLKQGLLKMLKLIYILPKIISKRLKLVLYKLNL